VNAPIQYIDEATIRGLSLTPREVRDAVGDAFRQRREGRASLVPKVGIYPPAGGLFHAMPAALEELVVVKWLTEGARPTPGRKRLQSTLLATSPETGELIAMMDAALLTGLRTAAVTALALQCAPPPVLRSIAFIGAGLQAHLHADALIDLFPLQTAIVLSRTSQSVEMLCDRLNQRGIRSTATKDAQEALASSDIVITAVPFVERVEPFLTAEWLRGDSFTATVDLGRSWHIESYAVFDQRFTDDRLHTQGFLSSGLTDDPGPFDADLPELLSELVGETQPLAGRTLLFAPGVAIADAAMALLVLKRLGIVPAA